MRDEIKASTRLQQASKKRYLQAFLQIGVSEVIVKEWPSKIPKVGSCMTSLVKFNISVTSTKYLHAKSLMIDSVGFHCGIPFARTVLVVKP